jgi:hypothetical protein
MAALMAIFWRDCCETGLLFTPPVSYLINQITEVVYVYRTEKNSLLLERNMSLKNVLKTSLVAWNDEDHPELQGGVDHFIRNQRKSSRGKRNE